MAKLPGAVQGARIVGERYVRSQRRQNPEGRMPLFDHLRELRNRVVKSALALIAGMIVGFVFFNPVWHFIERPLCKASIRGYTGCGKLGVNQLVLNGPLDAFYLRVKVALIVGIILSSPVWLYQVWSFIAPGPVLPGEALGVHLHRHRGAAVPGRERAGLPVARPVHALPARPDAERGAEPDPGRPVHELRDDDHARVRDRVRAAAADHHAEPGRDLDARPLPEVAADDDLRGRS